ncbi:MAG: GTP-binding protein [Arenicella sp.]|nr:GTP-binding protein [Arenicella sp.]
MIKKKVCVVGDFAVGKTSLTQKFVNNVFSEKYLTTVGVKIDTMEIDQTKLVIWDLAGRDSLSPINLSYLAGASGVIYVAAGSRASSQDALVDIHESVVKKVGEIRFACAINKHDLNEWRVSDAFEKSFMAMGIPLIPTSAKTGGGVQACFNAML